MSPRSWDNSHKYGEIQWNPRMVGNCTWPLDTVVVDQAMTAHTAPEVAMPSWSTAQEPREYWDAASAASAASRWRETNKCSAGGRAGTATWPKIDSSCVNGWKSKRQNVRISISQFWSGWYLGHNCGTCGCTQTYWKHWVLYGSLRYFL
jgi:hypothetical protein